MAVPGGRHHHHKWQQHLIREEVVQAEVHPLPVEEAEVDPPTAAVDSMVIRPTIREVEERDPHWEEEVVVALRDLVPDPEEEEEKEEERVAEVRTVVVAEVEGEVGHRLPLPREEEEVPDPVAERKRVAEDQQQSMLMMMMMHPLLPSSSLEEMMKRTNNRITDGTSEKKKISFSRDTHPDDQ